MNIQVSTKLNMDVEKESQKKIKLLCKIALIVGIIGLIAYIIVSVAFFDEGEDPFWLEIILYTFSILFALGVVLPITMNAINKKAAKTIENVINYYEFSEENFTVISCRGEEKIAEVKHYYNEITKIRKTENYIYLHLGLRGAYPIEWKELTEEEIHWILLLKTEKGAQ